MNFCLDLGLSRTAAVRLVGGNHSWQGQIEVFNGSQWGAVCHDEKNFDTRTKLVVCNLLGYDVMIEDLLSYANSVHSNVSQLALFNKLACHGETVCSFCCFVLVCSLQRNFDVVGKLCQCFEQHPHPFLSLIFC